MTGSLPSGRAGQAAALGLTLLALGLLWLGAARPLLDWYEDRAATLATRAQLAGRMANLVADLPSLEARLATSAATATVEGMSLANATLGGGTDATAGADLQQRVQEMAARAGLTLTSTEMLPTTAAGFYRRVGLRMAASATWPVLVDVLRAIGQASPRMVVDDLQLRGSGLTLQKEAELQVVFTVAGFRADVPAPGQPIPGQPIPAQPVPGRP